MPNPIPTIKLRPAQVLIVLLAITVLLVAFSIWGQYLRFYQQYTDIRPWMEFGLDLLSHKFYLDAETNIPTWFNTILLLIISSLFAIIAVSKSAVKDKYRYHWSGLSILFLILSIDELAVLHETLIKPMRAWLGLGGWFYFTWVVPGLVFIALVGLAYLGFFLHLDNKFKLLFFVSLLIYFSGAIGGEMFSGHLASTMGQRNFTYAVYVSLEESLELIGASLMIYSLLRYLGTYLPDVRLLTRTK